MDDARRDSLRELQDRLTYKRIRELQRQKKAKRTRPPITVDPNKTLDAPRYDSDPTWNEIEARNK